LSNCADGLIVLHSNVVQCGPIRSGLRNIHLGKGVMTFGPRVASPPSPLVRGIISTRPFLSRAWPPKEATPLATGTMDWAALDLPQTSPNTAPVTPNPTTNVNLDPKSCASSSVSIPIFHSIPGRGICITHGRRHSFADQSYTSSLVGSRATENRHFGETMSETPVCHGIRAFSIRSNVHVFLADQLGQPV